MKKLHFVTGNEEKVKEAKEILDDYTIKQEKIDYPEIQGELKEVAKKGAKWSYNKIQKPLFVEDSGLFIKAQNGFPGPYSSYFYKKLGNKKLLKIMEEEKNRKAFFCSIIAYKTDKETKLFQGKIKGNISKEIRGKHGFGYDPVFIPHNKDKTFGEMTRKEKNKYSHRKKALIKFSDYLS